MARQASVALLTKELRELLPLWAVTMVGLALAGVSGVMTPAMLFFTPAVILGTLAPVALGAMVIGHEYRHHTLTTSLSLPVSRRGVLAAKFTVLGLLLVVLAGAAWWAGARTSWILLPLALGFCVAPWLTLLTRSELAGMVFACAIPALLLLIGDLVADTLHGSSFEPRDAAYSLRVRTLGIGMGVLSAIATADTVRRFLSLQVVDGVSSGRARASNRDAAVARRPTNVYVALLMKELRLQTLPMVVACGIVLVWAAFPLFANAVGDDGTIARARDVVLPLFAMLLAIVTGSLASADERHLGMWAHQVLLPVPLWRQWLIKVAVVLGLSFVFALALVDLEATRWRFAYWPHLSISLPMFAVGAAALSLYVSSMSSRGLIALLLSVGAAFLGMLCAVILIGVFGGRAFFTAWQAFHAFLTPGMVTNEAAAVVNMVAGGILLVLPVVVLVWFALKNHRRLDHPARVIAWQIVAIVVTTVVVFGSIQVARAFESAAFERNRRIKMTLPEE